MLILVTGATGFIGRRIVSKLATEGNSLRVIARPSSNTEVLDRSGVDIRIGDCTDQTFLGKCVEGCDIVVNSAGMLGRWGATDGEMAEVNVNLVDRLLGVCQTSSVRHFVHFSTPGVVGMVGRAPECLPVKPAGAYERTKCQAEKVASDYHKSGNIPVTILRPDFVYGPGDLHKLRMFQAIRNKRFPILGSGNSLLHPTYVDDVANGLMLVLNNPVAFGQIFNLAGPRAVTVQELVKTIADQLCVRVTRVPVSPLLLQMGASVAEAACRVVGRTPPVTRQQVKMFTCDHCSDISKAVTMLGYYPDVSLQEGIKHTISWYKQEGYL